MSEIVVEKMRSRMLKETEGFLSQKLSFNPRQQKSVHDEFLEYFQRFAIRHGQIIGRSQLNDLTI